MAEEFNVTPSYIKQIRLKNNCKIKEASIPNNYIYNNEEFQVILGSLLGDGCLRQLNKSGGVILQIRHCVKQLDYLKYKYKLLKNNANPIHIYDMVDERRKNPDYQECLFSTKSTLSLIETLKNWHNPKKRNI